MNGADGQIIIDTEINKDGFVAGSKELESAIRNMAGSIDGLGKKAQTALSKQVQAFAELNSKYAQQARKVDQLKSKLDDLGKQQIPTQEFAEIGKQIDDDTAKLDRLLKTQEEFEKVGGNTSSAAYQKRQLQIEELRNSIKYAKAEQEGLLSSGKAFIPGIETEQYRSTLERLGIEEEKLRLIGLKLANSYASLKKEMADYEAETQDAENETSDFGNIVTFLKHTFQSLPQIMKAGIGSLPTLLKRIGSGMLSASKKTGSFVKSLFSIKKSSGSAAGSIFRLANMFKLMLIRMAMRAVISGVKEGMQNLVQYSNEANVTISSLISSLTYLKNSFSTAFAPILSYVVPALNILINTIAQVVAWIGQLVAALTGKGTFVKAVKVQEDYAKSLSGTGSAAKQAGKDAKGALAPFDELNQVSQNTGSSGGGGGGASSANPSDMFETVTIADKFKDIAQMIKDSWAKADFTQLGQLIGNKINGALEKIPWSSIQKTANKIAKSIATFLTGGLRGTDWKLIGNTVAQGLNTLFGVLLTFAQNFDWIAFGLAIAGSINGFFANFDWAQAAQSISAWVLGALQTILVAIKETDWRQIGESIKTFLTNIEWKKIFSDLWEIVKTLFGESLPQLFEGLGINGEVVTLIAGIVGAVLTLITVFNTLSGAVGIVKGIFAALSSPIGLVAIAITALIAIGVALWKNWDEIRAKAIEIWGAIRDWFQNTLSKIGQFFTNLWSGIEQTFYNVGSWFKEKFTSAVTGIKNAFSSVREFFAGVWEGIQNVFGNISGWFRTQFTAAWTAVKQVFSTGGKIFDGIKEGILNGLKVVINAIITGINKVIAVPFNGLNSALRRIKNINILGVSPFSWISTISVPQIPRLATGTVVPPRAGEFAAILGDNKRETEVVSPLSTMKQALLEALQESGMLNGSDINLTINLDGKQVYKAVVEREKENYYRTGNAVFVH